MQLQGRGDVLEQHEKGGPLAQERGRHVEHQGPVGLLEQFEPCVPRVVQLLLWAREPVQWPVLLGQPPQ